MTTTEDAFNATLDALNRVQNAIETIGTAPVRITIRGDQRVDLGIASGAAAVLAAGAGLAIAEHRALARVAHGKPRALHGWLR